MDSGFCVFLESVIPVMVVNMLGDIYVLIYRSSYLYICLFIIVCTYSVTNSIVHFIGENILILMSSYIRMVKVRVVSV